MELINELREVLRDCWLKKRNFAGKYYLKEAIHDMGINSFQKKVNDYTQKLKMIKTEERILDCSELSIIDHTYIKTYDYNYSKFVDQGEIKLRYYVVEKFKEKDFLTRILDKISLGLMKTDKKEVIERVTLKVPEEYYSLV